MVVARRKTRIENPEDLERVRSRIGEQNFKGVQRALADGASVWVFLTEDEIQNDPDLTEKEKSECLKIFLSEGNGYAGWVRPPKRTPPYVPGFTVRPSYDSHGNYRSGSGSSEGSRH